MTIHPKHEVARLEMATRLARLFYDNQFSSDFLAIAGDRFWKEVPRSAGEKHTPSPETRHLTLELLKDLEAKRPPRGPSLQEIAGDRDVSSWNTPAPGTVSDGSRSLTPNDRASHTSVPGPSDSSEARRSSQVPAAESSLRSSERQPGPTNPVSEDASGDTRPPVGLTLSETQRGGQVSLLSSYLPYEPSSIESRAAARKNEQHEQSDKLRILQLLRDRGPMTDDQIVEALGKDGNTARPRRRNLVQDELVTRVGTGKSALGNDCALWGLAGSQVSA